MFRVQGLGFNGLGFGLKVWGLRVWGLGRCLKQSSAQGGCSGFLG